MRSNRFDPPQAVVADTDRKVRRQLPYRTGVNLLALFLLVIALYIAWWAISFSTPLWLAGAVVAATCSLGLSRRNAWAEYLWYAIAAVSAASWTVAVIRVWLSSWPAERLAEIIIALFPGALVLVVCAGGSFVVAKHFRAKHNAP